MPRLVDITGLRFNRLVVVGREGRAPSGAPTWRARCDCGAEIVVLGQNIKNETTKSCGCLHKEVAQAKQRQLAAFNIRHGRSKSPEYKAWRNMRARCYDPKDKRYKEYYMRGITVYQEWIDSFEAFFSHVGERPSPKHSLDRIENDEGYFPGNVRWATATQQNNNKSTTPKVVFRGKEMSLKDAHRASGSLISYSGLKYRLFHKGWPIERALR